MTSRKSPAKSPKVSLGPKRPKTGFIMYMSDNRDKILRANPGATVPEVAALAAASWKKLDVKTKNRYRQEGEKEKLRYKNEKDAFGPIKKRKRNPNLPKKPLNKVTAIIFFV